MCYIVRKVIRIALMDWDVGQSHSMDREEFAEFKGEALMRCGRKSKDTYEPTVYLSLNSAKNGAKEVLGKTLQSFQDLETSSAEIEWDCFQVRLLFLLLLLHSLLPPPSFLSHFLQTYQEELEYFMDEDEDEDYQVWETKTEDELNVVTFNIPKLEDVFDFENDDLLWKAKFIYTYHPRGNPDIYNKNLVQVDVSIEEASVVV